MITENGARPVISWVPDVRKASLSKQTVCGDEKVVVDRVLSGQPAALRKSFNSSISKS